MAEAFRPVAPVDPSNLRPMLFLDVARHIMLSEDWPYRAVSVVMESHTGPGRFGVTCPGRPRDGCGDQIRTAVAARRSVLSGEPLPCCLLGHAEGLSDAGPADAPGAQDAHMVVDGGVSLGHHGLGPGQAREQLIVWLLVPRAE